MNDTSVKIAHEEILEEDRTLEQKYENIAHHLKLAQDREKSLNFALRGARGRLASIEPLYRKMYEKWWIRWFYWPYDSEIEGEILFRCKTCGGLFWLGGEREFTAHKGHQYAPCREYSFWEHLRILMGRIK